ncbi:hypothetical protein G6F47_002836 [Rhizopus delemar]|nr:hypothetical protein G6F53_003442 [Rhizopus delemar]KAG1633304.1 hypothetical protein G6F45_003522 [Rhizopus arrhizus]KAG1559619.1 hypothetical protein G6F49_003439 [Rhizopus delemar]KAG1591233.1 hypothetical protein G6F48_003420 [Rhizopus delemar]KAG1602369.1 hypothetical protein G6F47_002836 [Rhizopus delemar]
MSRRAAGPINDSSNARKKARVSLSIAGSSCTVAPPLSSPALVPVSSNFATPRLESSVDTEVIEASSDFTPEIVATQIQQLSQLLQQQQQQQQQQQRDSEAEVDHTKKECSSYLAEYYRDYVVGRRSEFDLDVTFAHKNNRKVKALLCEEVRKHRRFDLLTTSQVNTIIRSKYSYLMSKAKGKTVVSPKTTCRSRVNTKLSNRRSVYMANPSAFDARFPFAGKILTVDWTSDEENGPEDENGRTFVVKRPSFRSNEVVQFHEELQKRYKESMKKKGAPPTIKRIIENVEVEFPNKLDDADFPSWAFSSPALGFPTSVSASSSFAAANPMQ